MSRDVTGSTETLRTPMRWTNWLRRDRLRSEAIGSLAVSTVWNAVATIVSRGAHIVAMVGAARALGPKDFGALGILIATLSAVQVFAGLAFAGTTTKYVAEFKAESKIRAGRVMAVSQLVALASGLFWAAVVMACAASLSIEVMQDPALIPRLRALSLILLVSGYLETQTGALIGLQAFRQIAVANSVNGTFALVAIVFGSYAAGLDGAIWALVMSAFFSSAVLSTVLRRQLRSEGLSIVFASMWREFPMLWRFALPSLLVGLAAAAATWLCQSLLLRHAGYVEVGLFTAANQWHGVVAFLPTMFSAVLLPRLCESHGSRNRHELIRLSQFGVRVNLLIAATFTLIFLVCAPLLMRAYGEDFVRATSVLYVVILTAFLVVVQTAFGQALAAVGRMWGVAAVSISFAAVFIGATLMFADSGAVGLAVARLVAQIVSLGGVFWLYRLYVLDDETDT